MLAEQVKGKLNKMDIKEHRLFVQKEVMEQTYGEARKSNIPTDEEGQLRWALRESLRDIGGQAIVKAIGCSSLSGGGGELGTIKTLTYGSN